MRSLTHKVLKSRRRSMSVGCIGDFEMTNKILMMEDIVVIFEKKLKEHEASIVQKNQEMFHKQEQSILALIYGNNSLTNQRLDSLSKDIKDLKESLKFSKNGYDELEEAINQMKEELHVI